MHALSRYLLAAVLAAAATACGAKDGNAPTNASAPASAHGDSEAFRAFVHEFREATLRERPDMAIDLGRHEFDGQLADWSRTGLDRQIARLHQDLERAHGFSDEGLSEPERFERDYLIAYIDRELFWLEEADWPGRNPFFYLMRLDPGVYLTREYAPLKQRMAAFTQMAEKLPSALEQARENLRTPLPKTYVSLGANMARGAAAFLRDDVPQIFDAVDDKELQRAFDVANLAAALAYEELAVWFAAQEASATDEFALGSELYARMLAQTEMVTTPLDELERIGRADLERNLAALASACAEIAPEHSIPACVAMVQADKPEVGPVLRARAQLEELADFLARADLVTVPGPERALVEESPPYNRWNSAYISVPGAFEHNVPSIYYIAPPNPAWTEAERLSYIPGETDLLFTSVHEVWPGHFLQGLHANRSEIEFAHIYRSYAFSEGWAHYAEEMMWEAGLGDGDPRVHVGQLLNALLRNVRFLSAIGLHTQGMTVAESEQMFREQAFLNPGGARQQAARGTFDPAYLNYTLGKLVIRKLREDWTASRGGRAAWKEFHDTLLSFGAPPLSLVRRAMLGADAGPAL